MLSGRGRRPNPVDVSWRGRCGGGPGKLQFMDQLQLTRPLGVGGIIDATFTLYRRRFFPMVMVTLVLTVIPFALSLIGGCRVEPVTQVIIDCGNDFWYFVYTVLSLVAGVGAVLVAAGAYADIPADWRGAAGATMRRIGPILAAGIVSSLAVGIGLVLFIIPGLMLDSWSMVIFGMVLFIVPGIILLISFYWWAPALMIEKVGPIASLGRSWRLASGERGRLFLVFLVFIIISAILAGIFGFVLVFFLFNVLFGINAGYVDNFLDLIITLLVVPLTAVFPTVVYLDLRVRKEHLDKEELAAELSGWG